MKNLILTIGFLFSASVALAGGGFISVPSNDAAALTGTIPDADLPDQITPGHIASTGTATIASLTVTTSTSVGPACATGFDRAGLSFCGDSDGVRAVDITSVPVNTSSDFTTFDFPILNSTNAKFVVLRVQCQGSQDATDGVNDVSLFIRKPGSSGSQDNTTRVCDSRNRVASVAGENYIFDNSEVTRRLDANKDIDIACVSA